MRMSNKRNDKDPSESSRKRRREFIDAEEVDDSKRPRLDHVYLSEKCPPISREKHHKAWLMNLGCTRRLGSNMCQLPSPDMTKRSFSGAPTVSSPNSRSSQKSNASVHDTDYREKLEEYNTYVPGGTPPHRIKQEAEKIVFRQRESPELEDAIIDQLRETMKDLQNRGEGEVRNRLGALIIPGYDVPSDERLNVIQGQLWNRAVPVPFKSSLLDPPLPLPKPKPDTTFAFSKTAFTETQLGTMKSLIQNPNGPNFASPSPDIRFPFSVIEYKSQAKDGSIRVATNQAAGAGAIALNSFLELLDRGPGLDASDLDKPLFFSVVMDQNSAYVNVHWVGRTPDTNEHTFHLEELRMLPLRYGDSIQILQRALKNIHDYAAGDLLKIITNALDEYRNKSLEKRQAEAELRTPPSPPKPPPSKKTRRAGTDVSERATEPRARRQQGTQTPVEAQRSGIRTRRKAMLE